MSGDVTVHQTLHGYKNGHSMIAASLVLTSDLSTTLLSMSDLSGSTPVPGFEEYLTAYPLGEALYAFAKTWYAFEMPRPGSVWTHSLLIPRTEIDKLPSLSPLLDAFRRPTPNSTDSMLAAYSAPLQIATDLSRNYGLWTELDDVSALLNSIYSFPYQPIIVEGTAASRFQNAIISIWQQQWPRLRHAFSFCTGSLSARKIRGRPLDLQVVPSLRIRGVQRELPDAIEPRQFPAHPVELDWIQSAIADLQSSDGTQLRRFLWYAAKDSDKGRPAFKVLVRLLGALMGNVQSIGRLTKEIGDVFAEPSDALTLKLLLIGHCEDSEFVPPMSVQAEFMKALLRMDVVRPFEGLFPSIGQIASKLFKADKETALDIAHIALTESPNAIGGLFISGIATAMPPIDIRSFESKHSVLLNTLLRQNPLIAANPDIWTSTSRPLELLDTVAAAKTNVAEKANISKAIIDSNLDHLVVEAALKLGSPFVFQMMESVKNGTSPRPSWLRAASLCQEYVLEWLSEQTKIPPEESFWIVRAFDPRKSNVLKYETRIWLDNAFTAAHYQDTDAIHYCCFCLAIAFRSADNMAMKLAAAVFQKIHDAAEHELLLYESWRLLDDVAPPLTWWRDWDRCERLRVALIDVSIAHKWSTESFVRAIKDAHTFSRVFDLRRTSKARSALFQQVANDLLSGRISGDPRVLSIAESAYYRGKRQ